MNEQPYLNILFTLTTGAADTVTGTLLLTPEQAADYLAGEPTAMKLALSEHIADAMLQHHPLFADLNLARADEATLRAARQSQNLTVGISQANLCSILMVGDQNLHEELKGFRP
jgi:hypothetical protein